MRIISALVLCLCLFIVACSAPEDPVPAYDLLIINGSVYTGDGGEPFMADIAIKGDRIAAIGEIDAGAAADH